MANHSSKYPAIRFQEQLYYKIKLRAQKEDRAMTKVIERAFRAYEDQAKEAEKEAA